MRGKERLRVFCVPMLCIGKRSGKKAPSETMRFSAGPLNLLSRTLAPSRPIPKLTQY